MDKCLELGKLALKMMAHSSCSGGTIFVQTKRLARLSAAFPQADLEVCWYIWHLEGLQWFIKFTKRMREKRVKEGFMAFYGEND